MFRTIWIAMMGLLVVMLIAKVARNRAEGVPVFECKSRSERIYVIVMGLFATVLLIGLAIQ